MDSAQALAPRTKDSQNHEADSLARRVSPARELRSAEANSIAPAIGDLRDQTQKGQTRIDRPQKDRPQKDRPGKTGIAQARDHSLRRATIPARSDPRMPNVALTQARAATDSVHSLRLRTAARHAMGPVASREGAAAEVTGAGRRQLRRRLADTGRVATGAELMDVGLMAGRRVRNSICGSRSCVGHLTAAAIRVRAMADTEVTAAPLPVTAHPAAIAHRAAGTAVGIRALRAAAGIPTAVAVVVIQAEVVGVTRAVVEVMAAVAIAKQVVVSKLAS